MLLQLERIQSGMRKVVSKINNNEIPSTPTKKYNLYDQIHYKYSVT